MQQYNRNHLESVRKCQENLDNTKFNWKNVLYFSIALVLLIIMSSGVLGALDDDLISYFSLDSAISDSNLTQDLHGYSNLTVNNALNVSYGFMNGGYYSDGTNDWLVSLENYTMYNYTICFWYNVTTDNNQFARILTFDNNPNHQLTFQIHWPTTNDMVFGTNDGVMESILGGEPDLNIWYHVCGRYNNSDNASFFINGSYVGSNDASNNYVDNEELQVFRLQSLSTYYYYFIGVIDEIAIWNRSLSDSEISDIYNSGTGCDYDCIMPDTTPPVITMNSPIEGYSQGNNATVIFNVTSDSDGYCMLYINGSLNATQEVTADVDEIFNISVALGTWEWNVSCNDTSNNTAWANTTSGLGYIQYINENFATNSTAPTGDFDRVINSANGLFNWNNSGLLDVVWDRETGADDYYIYNFTEKDNVSFTKSSNLSIEINFSVGITDSAFGYFVLTDNQGLATLNDNSIAFQRVVVSGVHYCSLEAWDSASGYRCALNINTCLDTGNNFRYILNSTAEQWNVSFFNSTGFLDSVECNLTPWSFNDFTYFGLRNYDSNGNDLTGQVHNITFIDLDGDPITPINDTRSFTITEVNDPPAISCDITSNVNITYANITGFSFGGNASDDDLDTLTAYLFIGGVENDTDTITSPYNIAFSVNLNYHNNYTWFMGVNDSEYSDNCTAYNLTYQDTAPSVSLTSPVNGSIVYTSPAAFTGVYTDLDTDMGNCTLYINTVDYGSHDNLTTSSIISIAPSPALTNGTYDWNITCTNAYGSTTSETWELTMTDEPTASGDGTGDFNFAVGLILMSICFIYLILALKLDSEHTPLKLLFLLFLFFMIIMSLDITSSLLSYAFNSSLTYQTALDLDLQNIYRWNMYLIVFVFGYFGIYYFWKVFKAIKIKIKK